jgi:spectinomycin phosphotransferase
VREPPADLADAALLGVVREHWQPEVDAVEHLPLGFGAWHWRASVVGQPALFVTLDRLAGRHTGDSLDAAYRGASALASAGLEFVLAPSPTVEGAATVALGPDRVSTTPWVDGTSGGGDLGDTADARRTAGMLDALHAASPPAGLSHWSPLVGADLPDLIGDRVRTPWDSGPYAERARAALEARLADLDRWVRRYLDLAGRTDPSRWVATHGEPHTRNQLRTTDGRTLLVDWESLKLGPRERDLRYLVEQGHGARCRADPDLVQMFDLEWRLDEVTQYADRFHARHTGTESDGVALGGLLHELERPG